MSPFGSFAALIKGCSSFVAEKEVSPQEEMANPLGMKVFAVERHGLPEDVVSFRALCGVQSSPLDLCRIGRLSRARYRGRHRESLCASGLRFPDLSAQIRRANSCTSCKPAHMDASITRTGRNGGVCVEGGRGQRPRALFVVWM